MIKPPGAFILEKKNGNIIFQELSNYPIRKITVDCSVSTPYPYPHWTIKEINEQAKVCEEIIKSSKNGISIETSASPENITRKISDIIVEKLKERQKGIR